MGFEPLLAKVFCDKVVSCFGRFGRDQRIEHDPPSVALNEGNVGEVIAPHLIDAVRHLEETVVHVELCCVAPQGRIDCVRRGLVVADIGLVLLQVPDNVTLVVLDGQMLGPSNQTAPRVFEVGFVTERQRLQYGLVGGLRSLRDRFGTRSG